MITKDDDKDGAIVPYSDRKNRLAKRVEDAPPDRQVFFRDKMVVASDGPCEWCGKEGDEVQRWNMHPRNVLHHNRKPDGVIIPFKMCYRCCEMELAEPSRVKPPEAESRFHPVDISFNRDRSQDIGNDGRPLSGKELRLYCECGTLPKGVETRDVGFVVHDNAEQVGKRKIRPGD